jgi:rfaE bifunctional protein nucleotidyltransferase chain/domain
MTQDKIKSLPDACTTIQQWQARGEQVVFTNGCFDIVHLGHIDYLEKARAKGNRLIVGINTDASVQRLKGTKRPIVPEQARARMMASFEFVDLVVLFGEDTPKELIETLKPNILVKGSDYTVANIVGADFVLAQGGKVETIDLVEGYSTTQIIQKIREAYQE